MLYYDYMLTFGGDQTVLEMAMTILALCALHCYSIYHGLRLHPNVFICILEFVSQGMLCILPAPNHPADIRLLVVSPFNARGIHS